MTVWTILKNLQISLIVLPQALGYDRREAFNGENHHENHLKIPIGENHLKIEKWQIGENYHGQLQIESDPAISHLDFLQQFVCVVTVIVWIWGVHAWGCRQHSL